MEFEYQYRDFREEKHLISEKDFIIFSKKFLKFLRECQIYCCVVNLHVEIIRYGTQVKHVKCVRPNYFSLELSIGTDRKN